MSYVGKSIGHIQIVDLIGTGGMGEVYEGFDTTLERKVAVKAIVSKTRGDPKAKSRFLREARALSQLKHAHICQIYDYIEEKDGDFIILEYIEGQNLWQGIQRGIDKAQKFRIAEQIAQVLKSTHEKGIIHRDLKPSNVMLTKDSGIKVLDFGLARFIESKFKRPKQKKREEMPVSLSGPEGVDNKLDQTLTIGVEPDNERSETGAGELQDLTFRTQQGRVMGTPLYMSPEQAQGEIVSSASDMYSFGLLLQELFTGQLPYGETVDRTTLIEKAKRGESQPVTGVSSDLGALIGRLKSLAPAARPTAVEVVERLGRIREKPKKRIRNLIVAGVALVFALMVFKYTLDLRRERRQAIRARDEATSVVEFLVNLFEVSDPGEARGKTITAREILSRGAKEIELGLQQQPLIRSRMMETIGTVYRKLGLYSPAEPLLKGALNICEAHLSSQDVRLSESLLNLARLYDDQRKIKEAEELTLRSLKIREEALSPDHPDIAENLLLLGRLHLRNGKFEEGEELYRKALEIREKAYGSQHPDVAECLEALGEVNYIQSRFAEAEPYYQQALEIRESVLGVDHPDLARTLNNLANLYIYLKMFDKAEVFYRRSLAIRENALGQIHPEVADSVGNIGVLFHNQGKFKEAETYYLQALDIRIQAVGENHPDVAANYDTLAQVYHNQRRYNEAATFYEKSLKIMENTLGKDHAELITTIHNLALLYMTMERHAEAEALHKRGLSICQKTWGLEHLRAYYSLEQLANFYVMTGRPGEAEPLYRQAVAVLDKEGTRGGQLGKLLFNFGYTLTLLKKYSEAEEYYKKALSLQEKYYEKESEVTQKTLKAYAQLLRQLGRFDEAVKVEKK